MPDAYLKMYLGVFSTKFQLSDSFFAATTNPPTKTEGKPVPQTGKFNDLEKVYCKGTISDCLR